MKIIGHRLGDLVKGVKAVKESKGKRIKEGGVKKVEPEREGKKNGL
jgi:hypothetical protein